MGAVRRAGREQPAERRQRRARPPPSSIGICGIQVAPRSRRTSRSRSRRRKRIAPQALQQEHAREYEHGEVGPNVDHAGERCARARVTRSIADMIAAAQGLGRAEHHHATSSIASELVAPEHRRVSSSGATTASRGEPQDRQDHQCAEHAAEHGDGQLEPSRPRGRARASPPCPLVSRHACPLTSCR